MMRLPRYGLGLHGPPWPYPDDIWSLAQDSDYFVFMEEAISVAVEGLLRPDGEPISRETALGKRPWRFRSSGIQVWKFLEVIDRIEPLDHDNVTDDQRRRRRTQLIEQLGVEPLPLFDLYADEEDESLPFLRGSLIPGAWYWIGVRRRITEDGRLPVFVGAAELAPGPYLPGALEFLEAVPPYLEYRLRDIFSLVHVSDFGSEEAGGEAAPPPDTPHDGSDGAERSFRPWKSDFDQGLTSQGFEA